LLGRIEFEAHPGRHLVNHRRTPFRLHALHGLTQSLWSVRSARNEFGNDDQIHFDGPAVVEVEAASDDFGGGVGNLPERILVPRRLAVEDGNISAEFVSRRAEIDGVSNIRAAPSRLIAVGIDLNSSASDASNAESSSIESSGGSAGRASPNDVAVSIASESSSAFISTSPS